MMKHDTKDIYIGPRWVLGFICTQSESFYFQHESANILADAVLLFVLIANHITYLTVGLRIPKWKYGALVEEFLTLIHCAR